MSTIYHVNLMKPYHRRPDYVNFLVDEKRENIEEDAEIPCPLADLDFWEIISETLVKKYSYVSLVQSNFLSFLKVHFLSLHISCGSLC